MNSRLAYLVCFFLSGSAGLIYQIVWIRVLSLVFGNTVYAVSMVVAGFLCGLALGSHYWGRKIDSIGDPLKTYVRLEVGIAISAIAITFLIYIVDDLIVRAMTVESIASGGWQIARFAILFLTLLPPTFLMGGTLPVMGKAYVPSVDKVGLGIGSIYAANTYGAMAGSFLCGFALVPLFGAWGAVAAAVVLNLLVAAGMWQVSKLTPPASAEAVKEVRVKSAPRSKKKKREKAGGAGSTTLAKAFIPAGLALTLFAASGFCSLAFEVLWTRAFVVSFKSTVYLFSNLLTVFLFGMALGSHVFSKRLDSLSDPVKTFGLTLVGVGFMGVLSVPFFTAAPGMAVSMSQAMGVMNWVKDIAVTMALMGLVFTIPTFLMGLAYPLICKITTQSLESLGRDVGLAYAVGTLGGIVGSLMAGFWLLPSLGLQNSIFVVSALALATGYVALAKSASRKVVGAVMPVSAMAAVIVFGGVNISGVNIGFGAPVEGKAVFSEEGVMGAVRVIQERENGPLKLMVNNYQLATSGDVAVRFGHIPLILKPDAKDVLLISLGSGITSGSVSLHDVKRMECVEIVPTLLDAQAFFKNENHNIVADKRFHLTFWDGRHYVRVTKRKYDLVIADLFQPDSAGVGNLYTLEHFRNVKSRLNKGGAMAQWLPMYQLSPDNLKVIMRTFAEAFEHVIVWSGDINSELPTLMLMGSREPFTIAPDKLAAELNKENVKRDMIEYEDPISFLSFYVTDRDGVMEFTKGSPINTDDRPVIEYTAPRNIWQRGPNAVNNFAMLINERKKVTRMIPGAASDAEFSGAVDRYYQARTKILMGKVRHAARDYPGEFKEYEKAAEFAPRDPYLAFAVFDLGYLYYHRKDFRKAVEMLEWARQIFPDLLEAHFYLAKAYQYLGMVDKSKEVFADLARLRPDIAESLIGK